MTKNILMERYEVHERQIARWKVQIIAYLLGDKYVCIINNLDPNATICRVVAGSRMGAMQDALKAANTQLAKTAFVDVPSRAAPPASLSLSRLEYRDDTAPASYEVPEFLAMPMGDRMKMILSGNLAFIGSDGSTLPSDVAMRLLGAASAPVAA